jgi:hypothetical protein
MMMWGKEGQSMINRYVNEANIWRNHLLAEHGLFEDKRLYGGRIRGVEDAGMINAEHNEH